MWPLLYTYETWLGRLFTQTHFMGIIYKSVSQIWPEVRKFAKDKCCCQTDRRTDGLYPMTAEWGPNEKCQWTNMLVYVWCKCFYTFNNTLCKGGVLFESGKIAMETIPFCSFYDL